MSGGTEPAGDLWFEGRNATLKLIQLSAPVALEMMMMFFARHFVSSGITRDFDRLQPSLVDQRLNIAIHGSDTKGRVMALRPFQNFVG
jgi:hypothetical protein